MSVGLLGGSFDPAHEGHAHLTREALKRLALDRVWWLVSPGNPLKPNPPAPLADRIARARAVMDHPRVEVTDIEARIGTRYTAETLKRLMTLYPGVRFVWLMGGDNLAQPSLAALGLDHAQRSDRGLCTTRHAACGTRIASGGGICAVSHSSRRLRDNLRGCNRLPGHSSICP